MRRNSRTLVLAAAVAAVFAGTQQVKADAFSFGVMADTQQTGWSGHPGENGVNTVSTEIADALNQRFIDAGVKFVVQVGDLTNTGSDANLQTRWDHTQSLRDNGIAFYGLRGNHEESDSVLSKFQNTFIPANTANAPVHVASFDNTSYSVTYNNTKVVLLDIKTADPVSGSDPVAALASANTWMSSELSANDHQQAFVFQHKNLLGQNHKDNQFGGANEPVVGSAAETNENDYFRILATNNVKYSLGGHDHMHHRSLVTSPDGQNKVQEIIASSDSTKFYAESQGFSSRETTLADEQYKIGYYVFNVDGPRVTVQHWATPNSNLAIPASGDMNGGMPATPNWTLRETFGYSLNGKQVIVNRGDSYTGITDSTALAVSHGETGYTGTGTTLHILGGTNTITATAEGNRPVADDLNTGWAPRIAAGPKAVSDVLSLWGMADGLGSDQTDDFVLKLSYDPTLVGSATPSDIAILSKDANGNWVNTVSLNHGGTANFVLGDYSSGFGLGTYGVNAETHEAWAVVNHNSEFVVAVPEPTAIGILGVSALLAFRRRRVA